MYLHTKYWWQSEPGHCNTYGNWIETHYPTKEKCKHKSKEAVQAMVKCFSHLTVQVGYAKGVYHHWCKDSSGKIVDPTAKQFEGEVHYTLNTEETRFWENRLKGDRHG